MYTDACRLSFTMLEILYKVNFTTIMQVCKLLPQNRKSNVQQNLMNT